ncbi:DUF3888 domain-containing protein [Lysinibacillus sp. YS11]|uniref:DUF3888 domain-containing protein n=2 Tax=Lysinibacillus TaxID=400634 RepID=UPI0001DA4F37|nr:DUF3888 domain-containing protein [Lysinibacillus sp. YS11]AUS86872.1 DUF3888 domain-containing protein [Lysinibacillus sp. YS11]EFI67871.1 hypothetical protein BFZC1_13588 [Lysinibacillus fusiformis ZC1]
MKKFAYVLMFIFTMFILPCKIYAQSEQADEQLIRDTFITILNPFIEKEIDHYYGYPKQYGLYDVKILKIVKESQFSFKVSVEVTTFEHAHSPPYSKEIITFEVSPTGVITLRYIHEADDVEKAINAFYRATLLDIQQSFKLDLASYTSYRYDQLQYQAEINNDMKSLAMIAEEIVTNILFPERKIPYKNVIDPVTFIKGNIGYMLFKRADGTNVSYQLQKKDGTWIVTDKTSKPGRKMEDLLPWYI